MNMIITTTAKYQLHELNIIVDLITLVIIRK